MPGEFVGRQISSDILELKLIFLPHIDALWHCLQLLHCQAQVWGSLPWILTVLHNQELQTLMHVRCTLNEIDHTSNSQQQVNLGNQQPHPVSHTPRTRIAISMYNIRYAQSHMAGTITVGDC